ncbi:MAG: DUF6682 family protein [Thiohalocapsa sp.]
MTRAELIRIAREEYLDDLADIDDPVVAEEVYRWSTPFLLRASIEAERQACRRADLRHIYDESTESVCSITLEADRRSYPLAPSVLRIEQVLHNGKQLTHTTREELLACDPGWMVWPAGDPSSFFIQARQLTLTRWPSVAAAAVPLLLSVYREPLWAEGLDDADQVTVATPLEWPGEALPLVHWICYEAYQRNDEDTHNAGRAAEHLALFERAFGPALKQRVIAGLLESTGSVRYGQPQGYVDQWYAGPGCGAGAADDW